MVIQKSVITGVNLYLMFRCLYMKRTTESKTESKLGTGLEHKALKFTDYAIFKFQSLAIPGGLNIFCLFDRSSLGLLGLSHYEKYPISNFTM